MRRQLISVAALLATLLPAATANASRESVTQAGPRSAFEVVVFEADNCNFCETFRSDVLPLYKSSKIGRETPIRFVNVSHSDETKMGLSGAITMAPTVVVMHQGQEIDRIVGYTGPINFMKLIAHMLGRSE